MKLSLKTWSLIATGILIAVLAAGLLITRGTLASTKERLNAQIAAHDRTIENYRLAAEQRRLGDTLNIARVGTEQSAVTGRTLDEYQDRVAALRADFAERVRLAKAKADPGGPRGTNLPGVPDTARPADEAPARAQLPSTLALIASEQAEQLVAFQDWVKRQAAIDMDGTKPEATEAPKP